jgi:ABC-type glycerol-3-phosphate transport system substrate-binding protein
VGVSLEEWLGLKDMREEWENRAGVTIDLQPIDPDKVAANLDCMATTKAILDLIAVDNDAVGILVAKGYLQELSPYLRDVALPRDPLFQDLQQKHRIDGRDYVVAFHPNVKLVYYNQDILNKAKKQPPSTWEELYEIARDLDNLASKDPNSWGRVAIQAYDGKPAAVTVFEWVKTMKGDPLTLKGPETREAFKRLWRLAPYPARESLKIQFDSANSVLITDRVAVVDNWTYGIKVVIEDFKKNSIKVSPGLPGSVHVLGGDVLAIPTGVPKERAELAIKLIGQLTAKETQRALAEKLFWAPVREDVYKDLSVQEGRREYFQVILDVLRDAKIRLITPNWGWVQTVLSSALGAVLEKGRKQKPPEDEAEFNAAIDDLLRPYIKALEAIPPEYTPCDLVAKKTVDDKPCVPEVARESFDRLLINPQKPPDIGEVASALDTKSGILAAVNGRGELSPLSPKTMPILLVPNKKGE